MDNIENNMVRREFIKGSAIIGMSIAANKYVNDSGIVGDNDQRKVYRILNSQGVNVGTLPVLRAFAGNHLDHVSPFVMLDEFGPIQVNPGDDPLRVDAHPHAGVTPTTYFLEGNGHHRDSLNYDFQIGKGDFMMFNSGKGAIHMEETGLKLYQEGGLYHGFQIWLNTPAKYKFADPTTSVHREEHMDIIKTEDYELKVVLGSLDEAKSSIELLTPAFYYHIKLKANKNINIPVSANDNAFAYIIDGKIEVADQQLASKSQLVLYQRGKEIISVHAKENSEFLILGGTPLNETVYSYGPFVMNTEDQIRQCIHNYQMGKMGNPDIVNASR
jgi:redox-sensitive bicupin YhaK (pirin superfamily)